ncbi:MAG: hypothetical protein C0404_01105 [Verrucomicrobia bacterium]|nr:hypothetical protein [Verrucomicrobiota bacterium]
MTDDRTGYGEGNDSNQDTSGFFSMTHAPSAVIVLALLALFHFQGNTTEVNSYGHSLFSWLIARWSDSTLSVGDYSHGWLIPCVSIFILWQKRRELAAARKTTCWPALSIIVLGLLLHWLGARAQQPRLSIAAFIVLLYGIPFFLHGREIARLILFPCVFLAFCIPMNFFDELTAPLRQFAAFASVFLLNGLGVAVERSGSAIFSVPRGAFGFDVADPCSGIKSLLAMTALTAGYAYLTQKLLWKRWTLFLSAIPLAIVGNVARIVSLVAVAQIWGSAAAMSFYHDYSGYVVFLVVVLSMIGVGNLLNRRPVRTPSPAPQ